MCDVCGGIGGHVNGCPNGPEPKLKVIGICGCCDEEILEDEPRAYINGEWFHITCLDQLATSEILEICGIEVETD